MEGPASHTDASSISRFSRNSSESLCSRGAPSFSSFSLAREKQTNNHNSRLNSDFSPTGNRKSGEIGRLHKICAALACSKVKPSVLGK